MRLSNLQLVLEQIALLFASFVWTVVVLAVVSMVWVYEDVQARWEFVLNAPPQALAQAAPPTALPPVATPTMTPWRGPGPTATPTPTKPPTPTATLVVKPPDILPETFNADEPTPVPLLVDASAQPPQETTGQSGVAISPPTLIAPQPDQNPTVTPEPPPPAQAPPDTAGAGIPTRLVIESVGIDSGIIPVGWNLVEQDGRQFSIWQVADNAVGWHDTSAKIGQPGNTVLTGHHNIKGEVFRDLVNVEVGDIVTVYVGDKKSLYQVELKTIVKEKGEPIEVRQRNAQWIAPTNDERITMVTCWPYTNNTHRVIVVAKPV